MKCGLFGFVLLFLALGCASGPRAPRSFSQVSAPGWSTLELRDDVDYDRAWDSVYALLVRDFDMEFASREDGYMRTAWHYAWSGVYQMNYRVRVKIMFSADRSSLELKPEAHYFQRDRWVMGVDSRQISTLRTDLMGTVGRTAR